MNLGSIFNKKKAVAFFAVIALTGVVVSCQSSEKQGSKKPQPTKAATADTVSKATAQNVSDKSTNENTVTTIYYFYTTMRCRSCVLIEEYTKAAVEKNFTQQIKDGRILIKTLNIDEEQNKHFIQDYKLYTKSVIVSDGRDGKELRWKNLEQVWMLLKDQNKFEDYIKTEVESYLKG